MTFRRRLAIVGGGPIGTEMSQAFTRLGSSVTVFEVGDQIMRKDDPELARMLQNHLLKKEFDTSFNLELLACRKITARFASFLSPMAQLTVSTLIKSCLQQAADPTWQV